MGLGKAAFYGGGSWGVLGVNNGLKVTVENGWFHDSRWFWEAIEAVVGVAW